jgi:plastocyanin
MLRMRSSLLALLLLSLTSSLFAQAAHQATPPDEFVRQWRERYGTLIPAESFVRTAVPDASASSTKVFNVVEKAFTFVFNPSPFVVNAGDTVTLNISVPSNDSSTSGHGFIMEQYFEAGVSIARGKSFSFTFVANTVGTFTYFCTNSSCGTGHTDMIGTFIVNAAAPPSLAIDSVTPTSSSTAGGATITVKGSAFKPGATVTIGGLAATNVTVVDSTTLTAKTPLGPIDANATQPKDIVVANPDGTTVTKAEAFSWTIPNPSIATVSPAIGIPIGGNEVLINGVGFTNGLATTVTFGGVAAKSVTVLNAITLRAVAPAHAVGTVDVVLQVGTKSTTASAAFNYVQPPIRRRVAGH